MEIPAIMYVCIHTHTHTPHPPWSRLEEGVRAGGLVEVFPDGVVVHGRRQRHEHVPDGVGEGDDAVALEEEHAEAVDESAAGQLLKALCVALQGSTRQGSERKGDVTKTLPAVFCLQSTDSLSGLKTLWDKKPEVF